MSYSLHRSTGSCVVEMLSILGMTGSHSLNVWPGRVSTSRKSCVFLIFFDSFGIWIDLSEQLCLYDQFILRLQ